MGNVSGAEMRVQRHVIAPSAGNYAIIPASVSLLEIPGIVLAPDRQETAPTGPTIRIKTAPRPVRRPVTVEEMIAAIKAALRAMQDGGMG